MYSGGLEKEIGRIQGKIAGRIGKLVGISKDDAAKINTQDTVSKSESKDSSWTLTKGI